MPLMVLGIVFVIGLFAYYMFSTSGGHEDPPSAAQPPRKDDVEEKGNVIYLTDDIDQMKKNHRINK